MDNDKNSTTPVLTEQELTILRLIAQGLSTDMIAQSIGLKPDTVRWYRKRLHVKFDVHNMAELLAKAFEKQILRPN